MNATARPSRALVLAALLLLCGCQYTRDRLLDVTDVLDPKLACDWNSIGLGAKVEVSDYLGAGVGWGRYQWVHESYGRLLSSAPLDFMHFIVVGYDGLPLLGRAPDELVYQPGSAFYAAGINCCQDPRPPGIDRARIGAELLVLNFTAGIYLNLGELVDLLAGLAVIDLAGDDGLPADTPLELYVSPTPIPVP